MIKFSTFIMMVLGTAFFIWMLKVDLDENKKLHKPQFKLIEEVKATDTTQSMDLHPEDIKRLLNS